MNKHICPAIPRLIVYSGFNPAVCLYVVNNNIDQILWTSGRDVSEYRLPEVTSIVMTKWIFPFSVRKQLIFAETIYWFLYRGAHVFAQHVACTPRELQKYANPIKSSFIQCNSMHLSSQQTTLRNKFQSKSYEKRNN